jgi:glutamate synthase domain-containing protein 2/glutamate synthase domain-containing protein 1/glutamate synthase domain-containing protein 3
MASTPHELIQRYQDHPGRGGCGVGAVADLTGSPSHDLLTLALQGLLCMEHRGGSIEDTGDGAGLLLSTDRAFFERFIAPGRHLPDDQHLAVGVLFFPFGEAWNLPHWQHEIDGILRRHGLMPLGWRHVPVDGTALGKNATASRRDIWQVLIGEGMVAPEDLNRTMYRVKAQLERQIHDLYVASFSPRTLVYKALSTGEQLARFYPDLTNPELRAEVVVFHRRYSTNTFSNWYLAQVFRILGHNGEINTIKANRNAVQTLEAQLGLGSILMPQGSDSADMDRMVELFTSHGVSLLEALCRIMPRAYRDLDHLPPEAVRFHQGVQRALGSLGAWEGPAAIVATDGSYLVGALDRMGLRPLRYLVTHSGRFLLGSEIGAIPVPFDDVKETGQLDPGETIALHLPERRLLRPSEVIDRVVAETSINFAELAEHKLINLTRRPAVDEPRPELKPVQASLNLFGWTIERVRTVKHMAETGKEPITSMGYDRPLAPFSSQRPPVTKFFKQIVAVVTNPPIDPLREGGAFDLRVHLGTSPSVQENLPIYNPQPQYRISSPFLTEDQLVRIRDAYGENRPKSLVLDCTFLDPAAGLRAGAKTISRRIAEICRIGVQAARRGEASVLILSDRQALFTSMESVAPPMSTEGAENRLPLPMVLVTSALHNALVGEGLRRHAGLVVETGEVQEGHDAAVFIANGATALFPYLFYAVGAPHGPASNLTTALEETLKRIMSKMGICSVDGYRGSRLFEAVGLSPSVVDHYLPGITSRLGGLTLEDIYDDIRARKEAGHRTPRDPDLAVYRKEVWSELQTTARGHDPASYGRFLKLIEDTPPVYLRDLLSLAPAEQPLSLERVAPEQAIIASVFRGAAMSHGALHRVAHRAIAAAFNHFGASSNCGEGGEDPRRDRGERWEESRSRIRQVASGRFGVDARYLVHADEISIKIGQGAKPGEGGMLPAAKVTAEVAMIRKTQIGVTLISPPPHHDIYSIEDLAQLIYNLRQVNPHATVSVKIPAVTDIGTIAVGIAKAGADIIDVSGFEGGTGAASSSSIEHAGLPLERALSETHQALVINGIRGRVKLRADGGIKTGFDVAAVLALGADEVSLGTALMLAEQCIFCHGCANGMCPAGITTQSDLVARRLMTLKKGRGKDEDLPDEEEERYLDARQGVIRYLEALAGDLRQKLAAMGLSRPEDLVGRVDLLVRKPTGSPRKDKVDLAELLIDPEATETGGASSGGVHSSWRKPALRLRVDPTSTMNDRLCDDAARGSELHYPLSNGDRAFGATLAGKMALGEIRAPEGGFTIRTRGYAGQALGFALHEGMRLELDGFANDTVGEAMGGGVLVIRPPRSVPAAERSRLSVCGNAACYGATGGKLFVEGRAGQRVGVRNSGAVIVVEGGGKYAFEYMTGGVGVVLGPVGPVVGSGLTGGALFLLDEDGFTAEKVHKDAKVVPIDEDDAARLRALIEEHLRETGSEKARTLLARWEESRARFLKVVSAS